MSAGGSVRRIRLGGELDIGRKNEIRDALIRGPNDPAVLIDLSEATYADSVALTELLRFCVTAQHDGVLVALVIRTPQFARVVQYAGLAGAFKIFADRDAALEYLREGAQ